MEYAVRPVGTSIHLQKPFVLSLSKHCRFE